VNLKFFLTSFFGSEDKPHACSEVALLLSRSVFLADECVLQRQGGLGSLRSAVQRQLSRWQPRPNQRRQILGWAG
jgi:hypothetical protein